ncbi:MAG: hypothetical protein Q8K92_00065 [Leadbetterella sp.]|nr:hypothetical protein [Leadbetterella sp.]
MQNKILQELDEIKCLLAKLTGTADLNYTERFSIEALDKAAKEFQAMNIARKEWIDEHSVGKFLKNAPYNYAGKFIRENFGFINYFKRGRTHYYYKKDLIELSNELISRNVNLKRYCELFEDKAKFQKCVNDTASNTKGNKKKFKLPSGLKNINTSPPPPPSAEVIREDLKALKEEFFQFKLADYIDIYKNNYAMFKFQYQFDKYIKPELKRRSHKWCENFNYANHALELITKKREKFIPVKDDDMIQL